jgi:exopolyphosphatase/guanosine-5'-triphosphate,3'-diphosphate pyrophosphatase
MPDDPAGLLETIGIDVPDRDHAIRCATFAGSIFDGCHPRLELQAADRRLAVVAALLHDSGYLRGDRDHHRKSYDIVREAALPGFSGTDQIIAACAARYHGRTMPSIEHAGFGELDFEDQRRVRRLSAIVRLAAACDASHLGIVESVEVRAGEGSLVLVVRASQEPSVDRDRLREAAGGFAALTYVPLNIEIEVR